MTQTMETQRYPNHIFCIDTDYVAPGIACAYIVQDGEECALIETGTGPALPAMIQRIKGLGLSLEQFSAIIPTHAHLDHAGASGHWIEAMPNAKLYCHPKAARHLIDPARLEASARGVYGAAFDSLYGQLIPVPESRVVILEDLDSVHLNQRELTAYHTRGHADHHLCLWDEQSRGWFTGDTFGICYPHMQTGDWPFALPATTPTQFLPSYYQESIDIIAAKKPQWIYPTHYGRIPFDVRTAQSLKQQIGAYAKISDSEQAAAELQNITLHNLTQALHQQEAATVLQSLSQDLALNAQGVMYRLANQGR
jgi:glyoxylase-like metal-dependent hydrolase (beta-lactamase superfamily II)